MTKTYLQTIFISLIFLNISTNIHAQTPPNDECSDAISLTLGTQITGTNIGGTASLAEFDMFTGLGILAVCNPPNGFGIENAVWYEFTVENEGNHTLALTNTVCALSYAVYPMEDISCDNIFQSTLNSDRAFCVALGAGSDSTVMVMEEGSYYLIIDGAGGVSCDFNLEVYEGPLCSPPENIEIDADITFAGLSWESEGFTFNIEWGETGFAQGTGTMLSTTDNTYVLEGLDPLTTYDFYIQADCGAVGISDFAGPFSFTTSALPVDCPAPTNLAANNTTDTSAELTWESDVNIFDVEWGETGFTPGTGTSIVEIGNMADLIGLMPSTTYDYYVCARCPDGMGGFVISECAGPFTFTTSAPPCISPDGLAAENITDTSADLTWISDETIVNLEWDEIGFMQGTGMSVTNVTAPFNLTGLLPQTAYQYYVCTVCDDGSEECAGPFTFITAEPPCTPPDVLSAGNITDTSADLTWITAETTTNIEWGETGFAQGTGTTVEDIASPFNLTGLLPETFYDYYACTICDDGSEECAGPFTFMTEVACTVNLGLSTTSTPESGIGANDGSINLSINGEGTAPYTYSWSNGIISQNPVNLAVGNYCVTVTDANGCTDSICENVGSACADDWGFTATVEYESGVGMSDGTIDINVSGGVLPYTYAWNIGATSQDISGLPGGTTYSVLVTDATGCIRIYEVFIGTDCPQNFNLIGQIMDMEIGLMNGAINITVNGGTPPYVYSWSNGANTQDISGLAPGDYSVVVTDALGCNDAFVGTIEAVCPQNLGITSAISDESALDAGDGAIDITVNGGTPPYLYSWNNGATTQDVSGLNAGSYCVIVFDSGGCTANLCFNIGEGCPAEIISNIEVTEQTAIGDNDGEIDIEVIGGNPIYTYIWDNGSTNADQTDLAEGMYCLTVTDGLGCMQATCVEVTTFCPLDFGVTANITHESIVFTGDGEIDITVNDGVPPYAYFWSNGQATEDLSALAPGEYCVRVTDAENCIDNVCFIVDEGCPPNFVTVVDIQDVSVSGLADGSINQILVNGTPPYSFDWSTGETSEDISGLPIGIYTVTIVDAEGCIEIAEYEIDPEECPELITDVEITEVSTQDGSDGAIDITTGIGAQPLTYQWSTGETTEDIGGLSADRYFITVTDAAGCITQRFYDLDEPVSINNIDALTDVQLFPNPTQDHTQLYLTFDRSVDVQISVMNIVGQILDQSTQYNISNAQFIFNLENYADGLYFIRIEADGQQLTEKLIVSD